MILGIDAANIRTGGGVTHLSELLRAADPPAHGFRKVIVWSGRSTLAQIEDRPWLVKAHVPVLDKGLAQRSLWQRFELSGRVRAAGCDLLFVPGGTYAGDFQPMVTMSQNLLPFDWGELRRYGWSRLTLKWLLLRWTQGRTFRHANGVIFLTEYAREAVLKITGPLPCKTAIVPHGIRDRFSQTPKEQHSLDRYSNEHPFHILYVSIVDMYKHQWNVAEAVASLRRRGLPVMLDLIGPSYPPALNRLNRTLARHDPAGEAVRYLGAVPHDEMHVRYAQADLAVFASSCETFGQIVTEAMSAGLPIACSDRSAMPELLRDAGVYFDPETPAAIEKSLKRLLDSPVLRAEKARAAFELVQQYSWQRCAHETLSFLRECRHDSAKDSQ